MKGLPSIRAETLAPLPANTDKDRRAIATMTAAITIETPEPPAPVTESPSVVVIDTGDSAPTVCEHTERIMEHESRIALLESRPEPAPVIVEVEPEPEPEPIEVIEPEPEPVEDEAPERGHPWFSPVGIGG